MIDLRIFKNEGFVGNSLKKFFFVDFQEKCGFLSKIFCLWAYKNNMWNIQKVVGF